MEKPTHNNILEFPKDRTDRVLNCLRTFEEALKGDNHAFYAVHALNLLDDYFEGFDTEFIEVLALRAKFTEVILLFHEIECEPPDEPA